MNSVAEFSKCSDISHPIVLAVLVERSCLLYTVGNCKATVPKARVEADGLVAAWPWPEAFFWKQVRVQCRLLWILPHTVAQVTGKRRPPAQQRR